MTDLTQEQREKIGTFDKSSIKKSKEYNDLQDYLDFHKVNGSRAYSLVDKLIDLTLAAVGEASPTTSHDICKTCGFDKNAERGHHGLVVTDGSPTSIAHYIENRCEECGHQKDGSTIKKGLERVCPSKEGLE